MPTAFWQNELFIFLVLCKNLFSTYFCGDCKRTFIALNKLFLTRRYRLNLHHHCALNCFSHLKYCLSLSLIIPNIFLIISVCFNTKNQFPVVSKGGCKCWETWCTLWKNFHSGPKLTTDEISYLRLGWELIYTS